MTEDEMVGCHHRLNGHEFEQTLGDGVGQRSLMSCSPWGHKESDITEQLNKIRTSHLYNISGFACACEIRTRKLSKISEE